MSGLRGCPLGVGALHRGWSALPAHQWPRAEGVPEWGLVYHRSKEPAVRADLSALGEAHSRLFVC
jgi:hypothetical protein